MCHNPLVLRRHFHPSVLVGVVCLGGHLMIFGQAIPSTEVQHGRRDLDEDLMKRQSKPPLPIITGYSLSSEIDPSPIPPDRTLTLEPNLPEVVVFFSSSGDPSVPREYRYRLNYSGADWTETTSNLAHYRRLRPGLYRFEVQIRQPGQAWSASTDSLEVRQRAFFYQTWYFYMLVTAGLAVLLVAISRQRDRLLKGQIALVLEERNRIAGDCHDTLMAGFAAISWQMEATSKLFQGEPDKASQASESFELARKMVAHCQAEARRIIWNLRDSDEVIEGLPNSLARAINGVAPTVGIRLNLSVEGDEFPINPGAVHHLVCIGQEAIANALRHASPSQIDVKVKYETDVLYLTICDNGSGFPAKQASSSVGHFGIAMMKERARKLRASLSIRRLPEGITEVSVKLGLLPNAALGERGSQVVPWIGV
jgi:signal transduction histidine kinase